MSTLQTQRDATAPRYEAYRCAFIWDWQSTNPRRCYQCGKSETSHYDMDEYDPLLAAYNNGNGDQT